MRQAITRHLDLSTFATPDALAARMATLRPVLTNPETQPERYSTIPALQAALDAERAKADAERMKWLRLYQRERDAFNRARERVNLEAQIAMLAVWDEVANSDEYKDLA